MALHARLWPGTVYGGVAGMNGEFSSGARVGDKAAGAWRAASSQNSACRTRKRVLWGGALLPPTALYYRAPRFPTRPPSYFPPIERPRQQGKGRAPAWAQGREQKAAGPGKALGQRPYRRHHPGSRATPPPPLSFTAAAPGQARPAGRGEVRLRIGGLAWWQEPAYAPGGGAASRPATRLIKAPQAPAALCAPEQRPWCAVAHWEFLGRYVPQLAPQLARPMTAPTRPPRLFA
ncbi:hypothetical protein CDD83_5004 [Cordyceps sp. RAO-2017]|nr:hypothetical protein CDD83_5004 [Cordyceps sp. RAO-2017]